MTLTGRINKTQTYGWCMERSPKVDAAAAVEAVEAVAPVAEKTETVDGIEVTTPAVVEVIAVEAKAEVIAAKQTWDCQAVEITPPASLTDAANFKVVDGFYEGARTDFTVAKMIQDKTENEAGDLVASASVDSTANWAPSSSKTYANCTDIGKVGTETVNSFVCGTPAEAE